jgi:hypothetical protein
MKTGIEIHGGPLDGAELIRANSWKIFGIELSWWGMSQWYKWRWNGTHIDMGPLSIYGIAQPPNLLWRTLALAIKPMRYVYHRKFSLPNAEARHASESELETKS